MSVRVSRGTAFPSRIIPARGSEGVMVVPSGSQGQYRVLVVGVGDDGATSLSSAVLLRVQEAQLLVGGRRHLELFAEVQAERLTIVGGLDPIIEQIGLASETQRVVVLASGDPCFFGIGPLLVERLGRERVEILPNISSVALAFARLGVSWQDARVVSAHGRSLAPAIHAALGAEKLAVLTDDINTPAVIAGALLDAGADDAPAWVFEHLNGPAESETATTLSQLAGQTFASLNVLVVPSLTWRKQPESSQALFGLSEALYAHSGGMITKPEVRAISLSKLQLPPGGVLWDVGAASGSISIEAVGLVPRATAHAIERSPIQLRHLWRNVGTRTTDGRVKVVIGDAPEVFPDLPNPDAIFIGGSGGRLSLILDEASARLRANGRIVCNLVTVENLAEALCWSEKRGTPADIVQVGISRGSDIIGMTRLQAENPVTIVTLKP
jgi:precorrin-6Y C5,15-methyltransferase (decarboxylating)